MAKTSTTPAAVMDFTAEDFAAHQRTYDSFMSLLKVSIVGLVLLVVGLYFILFGGASIFGGLLIILSLIVPPVMSYRSRQ
ncbi:MAG TPA: aa3-type cytochrome c oxidase subunit IV [Devosiaceae bacterium]|jgi:hypothetical protein